jgi:hypothetical protein
VEEAEADAGVDGGDDVQAGEAVSRSISCPVTARIMPHGADRARVVVKQDTAGAPGGRCGDL